MNTMPLIVTEYAGKCKERAKGRQSQPRGRVPPHCGCPATPKAPLVVLLGYLHCKREKDMQHLLDEYVEFDIVR